MQSTLYQLLEKQAKLLEEMDATMEKLREQVATSQETRLRRIQEEQRFATVLKTSIDKVMEGGTNG